MNANSSFGVYRVAAIFDFDPIAMHEGTSLVFRLEVLEAVPSTGRFSARVWRRESLRVKPSFPLRDGGSPSLADEIIFVEDIQEFWSAMTGSSIDDVLAKVLLEFRHRFGVNC